MNRLHCVKIVLALISFLHVCDVAESACPPANLNDGTVTTYAVINETRYDRNYSRMDSGRRPLGFATATWHYNQGVANPCIKISATNARSSMLEIKVETEPPARLCVKDQSTTSQCFESTYSDCRETPADDVYVEFLCDSGCGEADVSFWYRLVLSPPGYVDWCLTRDNKFPGDLVTLPPGATLPTYTTPKPGDGTGAATDTSPSCCLLLAAALVIFAWFL